MPVMRRLPKVRKTVILFAVSAALFAVMVLLTVLACVGVNFPVPPEGKDADGFWYLGMMFFTYVAPSLILLILFFVTDILCLVFSSRLQEESIGKSRRAVGGVLYAISYAMLVLAPFRGIWVRALCSAMGMA